MLSGGALVTPEVPHDCARILADLSSALILIWIALRSAAVKETFFALTSWILMLLISSTIGSSEILLVLPLLFWIATAPSFSAVSAAANRMN
jgi:hypothetical protein